MLKAFSNILWALCKIVGLLRVSRSTFNINSLSVWKSFLEKINFEDLSCEALAKQDKKGDQFPCRPLSSVS